MNLVIKLMKQKAAFRYFVYSDRKSSDTKFYEKPQVRNNNEFK